MTLKDGDVIAGVGYVAGPTAREQNESLGAALAEVSAGLGRIEKGGKAPASMGSFAFVQETAVMEKLKPLLDERGILLRPDVEQLRLDLYPREGKSGPGVLATVTMALYAVRGTEEHLLARVAGQGADTQDKAVSKAITSCKKQALLVAFSIPTGNDPEAVNLDDAPRRPAPASKRSKIIGRLNQRLAELDGQHRKDANVHSVRAHIAKTYSFDSLAELYEKGTEEQLVALGVYLKGKLEETAEEVQPEPAEETATAGMVDADDPDLPA